LVILVTNDGMREDAVVLIYGLDGGILRACEKRKNRKEQANKETPHVIALLDGCAFLEAVRCCACASRRACISSRSSKQTLIWE
jgi:hypothetical protein